MTTVINKDDLLFAPLRARWLESPRQVAAELLEASAHAERLDGVTPRAAMVRAASVLLDSGEDADGMVILRRAVSGSEPGADDGARQILALSLAAAGETAEAEAVAREAVAGERTGDVQDVMTRLWVAEGFARSGHFDRAEWWAGSAVEAAAAGRPGWPKKVTTRLATGWRERLLREIRVAKEAGLDSAGPTSGARDAVPVAAEQPWPALSAGCLVWWPEPEYQRLTRHLPGVTGFLGSPWRGHTARAEQVMRQAAQSPGQPLSLKAASLPAFAEFASDTGHDPREPATMTAFTAFTPSTVTRQAPVPWPPRPRRPCWCGSGRRYQDCCQAAR